MQLRQDERQPLHPPRRARRLVSVSTTLAILLATAIAFGGTASADVRVGESRRIVLAGHHGLPEAGRIGAVVLSVTGVRPETNTFLTVHPAGSARPNASNVNVSAGQVVPNMVISGLGTGGAIDVYNANGPVEVVVDVQGWFEKGSFRPLGPRRLADTRGGDTHDGRERGGGALAAGATRTVCAGGRAGIPVHDVGAVSLNLTGISPTEQTFITVWPAGGPRPETSSLNLAPGATRANAVITELGANGCVSVFNANGATHLAVDVNGWLPRDSFTAVGPARLADTRPGGRTADGAQSGAGARTRGTFTLPSAGRAGLPTAGIGAVLLNVTAAASTGTGFVTVHPGGTGAPNASNLNVAPGSTVAVAALVRPANDGTVRLSTDVRAGSTHLIADVVGWVHADAYRSLSTPRRVLDTRSESSTTGTTCPDIARSGLILDVETDRPNHPVIVGHVCGIHAGHLSRPGGPGRIRLLAFFDEERAARRMTEVIDISLEQARQTFTNGGAVAFPNNTLIFNARNHERWNLATSEFGFKVGVHEWHHLYVMHRARSAANEPLPDSWGGIPVWLVEASAEWHALRIAEGYGYGQLATRLRETGARFGAPRFPGLDRWETNEGLQDGPNYEMLPHVGDVLIGIAPVDALVDQFFFERGRSTDEPWQVTFERVFGITVPTAYRLVSEHMRRLAG